jgi:hypothetical protein
LLGIGTQFQPERKMQDSVEAGSPQSACPARGRLDRD